MTTVLTAGPDPDRLGRVCGLDLKARSRAHSCEPASGDGRGLWRPSVLGQDSVLERTASQVSLQTENNIQPRPSDND